MTGISSNFSRILLPTNGDVVRIWLSSKLEEEKPCIIRVRNDLVIKIASSVLEILAVWINSFYSSVWSHKENENLLKHCKSLEKSYKRDAYRPIFIVKVMEHKKLQTELFDIAACNFDNFQACKCMKDDKVPNKE